MLEIPRASVQPRGPVLVTHVGRGMGHPCAVESTGRATALVGINTLQCPPAQGHPETAWMPVLLPGKWAKDLKSLLGVLVMTYLPSYWAIVPIYGPHND